MPAKAGTRASSLLCAFWKKEIQAGSTGTGLRRHDNEGADIHDLNLLLSL